MGFLPDLAGDKPIAVTLYQTGIVTYELAMLFAIIGAISWDVP